MPELVTKDEEGYMHVSYARANAVVASAVVELSKEVDALKAKVDVSTRDTGANTEGTGTSNDIKELMSVVEEMRRENRALR
jgi:hypothetical protein